MKPMMILVLVVLAGGAHAEPDKGNQLEFDESVVEGIGGTFSGVTAVRTKHDSTVLYTKPVDFKEKIQESLRELPYQPLGRAGEKK
jgi:hypothetical protein